MAGRPDISDCRGFHQRPSQPAIRRSQSAIRRSRVLLSGIPSAKDTEIRCDWHAHRQGNGPEANHRLVFLP